ncbi:MAG: peptide chain release factor N(5)-glutamine methyltransferase [Pseudomonadota bacterium]|nr:peptide chain release factor N(5)-glutamine methyltransferase [Pseudomonadota bacterium]
MSSFQNSLGALLAAGKAQLEKYVDSPKLDAELLLSLALGVDRATLYANPDREIGKQKITLYQEYIRKRSQGLPIAYLTGKKEFWSLAIDVTQNTLIPRPETEILVERTLERIPIDKKLEILDLGTGSGAISAAIATERLECSITATENNYLSLKVAERNFARLCPDRINTQYGNWFEPLNSTNKRFDVIVSNPPYIALNEKDLTDKETKFEPETALYSGEDGLNAIRIICHKAPNYLKSKGWLILEHGFSQAEKVARILTEEGFYNVKSFNDLNGHTRVTEGQIN